jgi:hypothetical protein
MDVSLPAPGPGLTTVPIAEVLFVPQTVEFHLRQTHLKARCRLARADPGAAGRLRPVAAVSAAPQPHSAFMREWGNPLERAWDGES